MAVSSCNGPKRGEVTELKNLINDPEIRNLVVNWKDLGLQLVDKRILNRIEKDNRNISEDCMREMLSTFLDNEENPTWEMVDRAVNKTKLYLSRKCARKAIAEKGFAAEEATAQVLDALQEWKPDDEKIANKLNEINHMLEEENKGLCEWKQEAEKFKEKVQKMGDNPEMYNEELGREAEQLPKVGKSRHRQVQEHNACLKSIQEEIKEWKTKVTDRQKTLKDIQCQLEKIGISEPIKQEIISYQKNLKEIDEKSEALSEYCETLVEETSAMFETSIEEITFLLTRFTDIMNYVADKLASQQNDDGTRDESWEREDSTESNYEMSQRDSERVHDLEKDIKEIRGELGYRYMDVGAAVGGLGAGTAGAAAGVAIGITEASVFAGSVFGPIGALGGAAAGISVGAVAGGLYALYHKYIKLSAEEKQDLENQLDTKTKELFKLRQKVREEKEEWEKKRQERKREWQERKRVRERERKQERENRELKLIYWKDTQQRVKSELKKLI